MFTTLIIAIVMGLLFLAVGMALQDKTGLEKLEWDVAGGPIVLDAQYIAPEDQMEIERILQKSSKGTSSRTGNKRLEYEFDYRSQAIAATIDAEDGNVGALKIFQLGNTTATEDLSVPNVSINVMNEAVGTDPEAEQSSPVRLKIYRTWNG